jgi:hypothetical protein
MKQPAPYGLRQAWPFLAAGFALLLLVNWLFGGLHLAA